MRRTLNESLKRIRDMVVDIINMGKESLYYAIQFLIEGKDEYLKKVDELEVKSDDLNLEIQDQCTITIARQQPVAKDVRFITSMMYISSFFERICDLTQEFEREKIDWSQKDLEGTKNNIMWITQKVISMMDVVLNSILTGDTEHLKDELERLDSEVDNLYDRGLKDLIDKLVECKGNAEVYVKAILILRHLERIGDIVAKAGARVIYIEEGKHVLVK